MNVDPFSIPSEFNGEVRLFPLNDHVFFPHNVQPLRIFEGRYREMMEDALDGDQLITMATLEPGHAHDYYSRPPVDPMVCIGRVTSCERTEDGRYSFMLVGLQPARIEHEIEPVRAFRRASVTLLDDVSASTIEENRQQLERFTKHVIEAIPDFQTLIDDLVQRDMPLAAITNIFAFHLPLPTNIKLQLLAEPDAMSRADLIIRHLKPQEKQRNPPPDFSNN